MFGKPLSALTHDDILRLCIDEVRESDVVEFKEALSGRGGSDGWHTGASSIGAAARDKIVNEIVAFANAHGGTLVLGIAESDDKPARAERVAPIQRCADLAERLSRALADTVEPPLAPYPQVVPVPIDGDAGVVVFQVAASRNAPHRHRSNFDSYIRRGEQAVPMTMREIQDLTLQIERGLAAIERRFEERATMAQVWTLGNTELTLRATGIPLSPIDVPDVPGSPPIHPVLHSVLGRLTNGTEVMAYFPVSLDRWRPIVRGVRTEDQRPESGDGYRVELQKSGLVESLFAMGHRKNMMVYVNWIMGLACNSLVAIERTRRHAGTPATEYGLELALVIPRLDLPVASFEDTYGRWGPIRAPGCVFPRYSVRDPSTFDELLRSIQQDFWNAAGHHPSDREYVTFDLAPYLDG